MNGKEYGGGGGAGYTERNVAMVKGLDVWKGKWLGMRGWL